MPGRLARWGGGGLLLLALLQAVPVQARTEVLITGEWPPYTGIREPNGGSISAVVRQALAAEGLDVKIGFFAWNRLRPLMDLNRDYGGRFPDYYSRERSAGCYYSDVIGESPLGLAELRATPVQWNDVRDLENFRIGTVKTYVNTPEFDRLVKSGKLSTLSAADDEENLDNLIAGKVDAAVIDRNVYAYLMTRSLRLKAAATRLQLNPKVMIVHKLYVCFSRNEKGRVLRDKFNKGLKSLQAPGPN